MFLLALRLNQSNNCSVEDVSIKIKLLRAYVGEEADLITVVPRGVAATFPPMTCDATNYAALQSLWEGQDTLPGHGSESLFESYAYGENVGMNCAAIKPDLIPFSGTVSVANDVELVREALGQDQLQLIIRKWLSFSWHHKSSSGIYSMISCGCSWSSCGLGGSAATSLTIFGYFYRVSLLHQ